MDDLQGESVCNDAYEKVKRSNASNNPKLTECDKRKEVNGIENSHSYSGEEVWN